MCEANEVDLLLLAHAMWLTWLPEASAEQQWQWGTFETRFVPNKQYCVALLVLVVLTTAVVLALHVGARMGNGDAVLPDDVPWSVLAAQQCNSLEAEVLVERELQQGTTVRLAEGTARLELLELSGAQAFKGP
jgi:hypothetical protein